MHIALAVAFGMVAVAPFFGRWRANVWVKKNMPAGRVVKSKGVPAAAKVLRKVIRSTIFLAPGPLASMAPVLLFCGGG